MFKFTYQYERERYDIDIISSKEHIKIFIFVKNMKKLNKKEHNVCLLKISEDRTAKFNCSDG